MESLNGLNKCNICNKIYKSYKSLWNHNKKYHINGVFQSMPIVIPCIPTVLQKDFLCKFCSNNYSTRQNKWKHEQKCQPKHNKAQQEKEENDKKRLELEIIKENNIRLKEEARILNLKLKLQKSEKVDNITLKKLNKLLLERHNRIKNSNVNSLNNNTINNNHIVNNFQLIGFGKEEVTETLTKQDKKLIINARYNSLDKLIEIIHCGKYNQFKNIIITNMNNNYMYKYDDKVGHFVLSTKTDILNSLIDYRLDDLEIIYNDLLEKNKLDENTKDIIEKFINKINHCESKYTDYEGKEHDNYKQYKIICTQ